MQERVDRVYSYIEVYSILVHIIISKFYNKNYDKFPLRNYIIKEHKATFDLNEIRDFTNYFIDEQRRHGEGSRFTGISLNTSIYSDQYY